ncbi:MAG: McrC family protein [Shewanella sp.]
MHITVFEYGYLSYEPLACKDLGAKRISQRAFEYIKEVCLGGHKSEMSRCFSLTKCYGYELLQVQNYVGVIMTPTGEQIEVLPKIGRKSVSLGNVEHAIAASREVLLTMLYHLGQFRHLATLDAHIAGKSMPLLEVFIRQFLQSVNRLVKRGLRSDYIEQQDNLSFQKGKLNVSQQLRHNLINKQKFSVEYDEFLTNRPANRLIKTALKKLTRITQLAGNQRLLQELTFAFAEIPLSQSIQYDFNQLRLDRSMQDYHVPLAWAKLVLDGISPLCMKGEQYALSLLYPMEAVFESYVASVLRSQLCEDATLTTQASSKYLVTHHARQQFQLKPDLLITTSEQSLIVLDTKWKILDLESHHYGLSQSDLYQMFAYGHKYLDGAGELYLIYPAHEHFNKPIEHSFDFARNLKLWVVPFELESTKTHMLHITEKQGIHKIMKR